MNINKYNLDDLKTVKNLIYILNDKLEREKEQSAVYIRIIGSLCERIDRGANNESINQ